MLVSYDIRNPRRLVKVAKTMEQYGLRVQCSTFECRLTTHQLQRLKHQLLKLIDPSGDSVRFYPLCNRCQQEISILGKGDLPYPDELFYMT